MEAAAAAAGSYCRFQNGFSVFESSGSGVSAPLRRRRPPLGPPPCLLSLLVLPPAMLSPSMLPPCPPRRLPRSVFLPSCAVGEAAPPPPAAWACSRLATCASSASTLDAMRSRSRRINIFSFIATSYFSRSCFMVGS